MHAVRCCDDSGSTCASPTPCQLASTYQEAEDICYNQGLALCPINDKLPDVCCGTGCEIDPVTMWLANPFDVGSKKFTFTSSSQTIGQGGAFSDEYDGSGSISNSQLDISIASSQGNLVT